MTIRANVLIADSSEEFCGKLKEQLTGTGVCGSVKTVSDGVRASELLAEQPDVLILDLMLPKLDGMSVLKQAAVMERPPQVIVLSSFVTDYVAAMTSSMAVPSPSTA